MISRSDLYNGNITMPEDYLPIPGRNPQTLRFQLILAISFWVLIKTFLNGENPSQPQLILTEFPAPALPVHVWKFVPSLCRPKWKKRQHHSQNSLKMGVLMLLSASCCRALLIISQCFRHRVCCVDSHSVKCVSNTGTSAAIHIYIP